MLNIQDQQANCCIMRKSTCLLASILFIFMQAQAASSAKYGRWEKYALNVELSYPDFKLTFLGEKKVNLGPLFSKRYEFEVKNQKESKRIFWSPGAGDIAPTIFSLSGQEYVLEMYASSAVDGRAPQDHLMLWPRAEWQQKADAFMQSLN